MTSCTIVGELKKIQNDHVAGANCHDCISFAIKWKESEHGCWLFFFNLL